MNEFITAETFNSIENLEEFIERIDPASYLARVTLEYLVINSKSDLLERLIEKLLACPHEESREWAEVYQIDHLVYKKEMSLIEATRQLTYKKVKSCELATLIKVFQLYNYYDLKNFEMRASLSALVEVEIPKLNDGFMKNSLICREKLIMQGIHLHLNEIEESRNCGKELLDVALTPMMKAIAYNLLGNSFILSNKEMSLEHFRNSLLISKKIRHERIHNEAQMSMNFTYCYWDEPQKVMLEIDDKSHIDEKLGYVYFLIKNNQKHEALSLLNEVQLKIENDYVTAFEQYYRGLITGEKIYFDKSSKYFELAGNLYFKQLPLFEL